MSFPVPPNNRAFGTPDPPGDMDKVVNILNAMDAAFIMAPSGDTTGITDTNLVQTIAANMAAANPPGGRIVFRPGRFWISQMKLYSAVEYVGSGLANGALTTGTIISAPAGNSTDMVVPSGSNVNTPAIRHITFDGGNGTNSTVLVQANQFACINFTQPVTRPILDDVLIYNVPGDSIVTVSGSYSSCEWRFVKCLNGYGRGFNLAGSDFHLTSCEVGSHGLSSFVFSGSTVQGVELKSNFAGARGVVGDTHGLMVTGNACNIGGGSYMQNDCGSQSTPPTFTATNGSPCVFTATGQVPFNGTPIVLSGSPPTGFTAGTIYFVVAQSGSTFELAATLGGAALNSSSTGSGTATPYNGNSVYVSGTRNRIDVSCAGSSNAMLYLDSGAVYNSIDLQANNQQNSTNPQYWYQVNAANVKNNRVRLTGSPILLTGIANLTNGGTEANNQFSIDGEDYGHQVQAFTASFTPDPYQGSYIQFGTITGAVTINQPANGHPGTKMILRLLQNVAGGNTVSFGGNYKLSAAIPTTGSTATEITFVCEATGGIWREVARATA